MLGMAKRPPASKWSLTMKGSSEPEARGFALRGVRLSVYAEKPCLQHYSTIPYTATGPRSVSKRRRKIGWAAKKKSPKAPTFI